MFPLNSFLRNLYKMANLDGVFYLSLATMVCAGFGLAIKTCYRIKCDQISICGGCLNITRDIEHELRVDLESQTNTNNARRSSLTLGLAR
jgi:hypothetical protein